MDQTQRPANALVLGGGGPVGASWTSAYIDELRSAGLPFGRSGTVLGTSAGAVVGAWLTMRPEGLSSIAEAMHKRATWHAEKAVKGPGGNPLMRRMAQKPPGDRHTTRSIAQAAVTAVPPISADQAEALWRAALPEGPWPERLRISAVNVATGAARVWSADDGISLAVAVSCSTAAPGAAPPVEVAGAVWVDGGVRSGTNADLLMRAEADRRVESTGPTPGKALVVAPIPADTIAHEVSILAEHGYDVRVVVADPFFDREKGDLLNPDFIGIATATGTRQARETTSDLAKWWEE
jgi:NTE family protein